MYTILCAFFQCFILASYVSSSSSLRPIFNATQLTHEIVTFDTQAVRDAAVPFSRSLLGLSIEFCYITTYLGDVNQPNMLSFQLLQNIQNLIGSPPRIRVGGNTQDVAQYCHHCPQTLNNTFVPGNTEAVNVTFNKNLFVVLNENIPSEQEYIFGLNLGQNNIQYPFAEFTAAETYMNLSRFTAYELGNEPDIYYPYKGKRGPDWDVVAYASQTASFLLQFTASLSKARTKDFPGYMYASITDLDGPFSFASLVKLRVPQVVEDIKIMSRHCYFGLACLPELVPLTPLKLLLNHHNTLSTAGEFIPSIETAKSVGAKFFMGETNSIACHGVAGVSDTLGAALWMLDYSLTSATLGIDGLYFHNGVSFHYSVWEPTTVNGTAPHAKALYFGFLFFADLVSDLYNPRISHISSLDEIDLAHYAVYSSTRELQKLVIINLDYCNSTVPRTYKTFNVSSIFGKGLIVKRLTGGSSVAITGITWVGQTVNREGNLAGSKTVEECKDGVVTVGSSEAVIIERV
ncbi:hypothetical protein B0O99DRAFT_522066 [Bisporella sp. PMI_857]|nr:hypothetical protein B0O99DRAFT_522066 [Bisporella sp. PMI_857]